jgi:predicted site-specific integrase-resolvase
MNNNRGDKMSERSKPQLLTPEAAAESIAVDREQVYLWMAEDRVPFVDLQDGEYRVPLQGLHNALPELLDLEDELDTLYEEDSSSAD